MKNFIQIFSFLIVFTLFFSCENNYQALEKIPNGYDYYPTKVGSFKIYEVDEIKIKTEKNDTLHYFMRETIIDSAKKSNHTLYYVRQETKHQLSDKEWIKKAIWTFSRHTNYLSITQNNVMTMQLIFPVKNGQTWDGNSVNTLASQNFTYQKIDKSPIDSIKTENVIKLVLSNVEENITGEDLRHEIYAKEIGLISKSYSVLEKCTSSKCGTDLGKVINGYQFTQKLIEIGFKEIENE